MKDLANGRYILDKDGNPVLEPDLMKWARWFETSRDARRVARDEVNGITVSTMFLGLDHGLGTDTPLLYETMTFPSSPDQVQERYPTRKQALDGHRKVVEELKRARTQ